MMNNYIKVAAYGLDAKQVRSHLFPFDSTDPASVSAARMRASIMADAYPAERVQVSSYAYTPVLSLPVVGVGGGF
jgi:hypothetical protein